MEMEAETSPPHPFSTAGLGPCELSCAQFHSTYPDHQRWVFWSEFCNDKVHCGKPRVAATADGAVIKSQIIRFLQLVKQTMWCRCLVQLWGLVKIGHKTYLTTCDQPFALFYSSRLEVKELCEYRKHCLDYLIPLDDDDDDDDDDEISVDQEQLIFGPPGRVFWSGLPEYTEGLGDYTGEEYPQREYAVGRVEGYWALPIYGPTGHRPGGVLEIVSTYSGFFISQRGDVEKLQNLLRKVNLRTTCMSAAEVSSCRDGEIAIIEDALNGVREIYDLDGFGTWTTSGEILSSRKGVNFIRKGQGVVGKAFSSRSACFCRDISQLSITEYPLVPIARRYEYSACFAVCLQRFCLNNCIYVLEFFLPVNEKGYGDPRTMLPSLMEALKKYLQSSFKIASGQELGQKLTVEVIKVSPEDEFDSFEICNSTSSECTPRLEEVQGGAGMMQLDFSSQQVDAANASMNGIHEQQNGSVGSTDSTPRLAKAQGGEGMMQLDFSSQQVDTANACINGVHGQQNGIVGSPPRPEPTQDFINISYQELNLAGVDVAHNSMNGIYEHQYGVVESPHRQELPQNIENIAHDEGNMEINLANPERGGASIEPSDSEVINIKKQKSSRTLKSKLGITREVLEQNSWRNLKDAAKVLQVSRSTLKRICRECGINRWPPRKARVAQPSIENIEERHRPDTTRLEDDSSVSVKVEYQGYTIKFRLPLSASKFNLEEKVAQRLNAMIGSFKIEYQDEENEWIWIACDEDLSTCMSALISLGRTTIKMLVR